jgi:Transposase
MTQPTSWPVFAGIDWGGSHHQLCILDTTGKKLTQLRVTHDVTCLTRLDTELARHDAVPVAVERSEGLLVEHLQARGHAVFPVSPRICARARERYRVAAVKDDRFDAFVLADTCATNTSTGARCRSPRRCSPRSKR